MDTKLDKSLLEALWKNADWPKLEEELFEMQKAIALAVKAKDYDAVRIYQEKLTNSFAAKMLAVRHIAENCSSPGVDGVVWNSDFDCANAVFSLKNEGYIALPMKLMIIRDKFSQKERHIKIPTYHDRAMQVLHAFSLMPVAEISGDERSFAFRRNRSTQDAHTYIVEALRKNGNFVLKTDVKACYASISHDWLLKNIPMNTEVLRAFLKSGHVDAGNFFPAEDHGISLGVSLSPILGNMVLDGLQKVIFEELHGSRYCEDFCDGHLVRFADDIFVTADTQARARKILGIIEKFLEQRGMQISRAKTKIINCHVGFDFLSRHYSRRGAIVVSRPSDKAIQKMEFDLKEMILSFRGSQKSLIERLNKKLLGWATYHRITDAKSAFRHIDLVVKALLLQLCQSLHPRWSRKKIIERYFCLDSDGEYVYALVNKRDFRVARLRDVVLVRHIPININPFLDKKDSIEEIRKINNVVGKYKSIWSRQNGICAYCGLEILADQEKAIVYLRNSKSHAQKNDMKHAAYIHSRCQQHSVEFIESDCGLNEAEDLRDFIKKLTEKQAVTRKFRKFQMLADYFQNETRRLLTLSFEEIEKISAVSLCASAFSSGSYWYDKRRGNISDSWISNGYEIRKLNIKKRKITFARAQKFTQPQIPKIFLEGRIPQNAKIELEFFLDYLRKKYGLDSS